MKRQKVILTNDFHNTSVELMAEVSSGRLWLSKWQIRKSWKALCGMTGCQCSGYLGERPRTWETVDRTWAWKLDLGD